MGRKTDKRNARAKRGNHSDKDHLYAGSVSSRARAPVRRPHDREMTIDRPEPE